MSMDLTSDRGDLLARAYQSVPRFLPAMVDSDSLSGGPKASTYAAPPSEPTVARSPYSTWRTLAARQPLLNFWTACFGLGVLTFLCVDGVPTFISKLVFLVLIAIPLYFLVNTLMDSLAAHEGELAALRQALKEKTELAEKLEAELQVATGQLKERKESKDTFMMQVIERVTQLLKSVIGRFGLLADIQLPPEQENYLKDLKELIQTGHTFLADATLLVRADARQVKIEAASFNIETLIESIMDEVAPLVEERDIDIIHWVEPDVPLQLISDVTLLRKMISNIVGNAVKFTHKGEVVVLVSQSKKTASDFLLSISVTDTGPGLTVPEIERLFKPFPELSAAGTGLGFSICDRLSALFDGKITVKSEKNRGSVITLVIPISINRNCPFTEKLAIENIYDLSVLLLDDHPGVSDIVSKMLKQLGARVDWASNWLDGLNAVKSKGYDLLLLSSSLPDIDCVEYCKAVKKDSKNPSLPIFVLANNRFKRANQATPSLLAGVVTKPLKRNALVSVLGSAMDLRRISPSETAAARRDPPSAPFATLNVLVAEDNALSQRVLRSLVERAGHKCKCADDGQQAVEAYLADSSIDVIFMDCRMPVMDGWVATKTIRAKEAEKKDKKRVYIVALTADSTGQEASIKAGMDDYLVKPVNKAALIKVFHDILEKKLVQPQKPKMDRQPVILLAEDNPVAANIASTVLRQHYQVEVAAHGRMALEMVRANRASYDLILMDVDLPVIDGVTCAKLIREHEAELGKHAVPIIALVSDNWKHGTANLAPYFDAGFTDVIRKPIDYPDLLARLQNILKPG